jgi:hypothetical protein
MAKINEALRSKLVFERIEMQQLDGCPYNQIIISTTYDGIYRQYSYINYPTDLKGIPQDVAQLEEEAKNILAWAIEKELNKRNAMTAKEKAVELLNEFEELERKHCGGVLEKSIAKRMAEILAGLMILEIQDANIFTYWKEVKQELEKL